MQLKVFGFHCKIYTTCWTHLFTRSAQCAVFNIYCSRFGVGNTERYKSCFAPDKTVLILIPDTDRACLFTQLTCRTIFDMNITWFFSDMSNKIIICCFRDISNLTLSEDCDIFMACYFRYFGCGDTC